MLQGFLGIKFSPLILDAMLSVPQDQVAHEMSGVSPCCLDKQKLKKKKNLINFCKLSDYFPAVRSKRLDEATTPGADALALAAHRS